MSVSKTSGPKSFAPAQQSPAAPSELLHGQRGGYRFALSSRTQHRIPLSSLRNHPRLTPRRPPARQSTGQTQETDNPHPQQDLACLELPLDQTPVSPLMSGDNMSEPDSSQQRHGSPHPAQASQRAPLKCRLGPERPPSSSSATAAQLETVKQTLAGAQPYDGPSTLAQVKALLTMEPPQPALNGTRLQQALWPLVLLNLSRPRTKAQAAYASEFVTWLLHTLRFSATP